MLLAGPRLSRAVVRAMWNRQAVASARNGQPNDWSSTQDGSPPGRGAAELAPFGNSRITDPHDGDSVRGSGGEE